MSIRLSPMSVAAVQVMRRQGRTWAQIGRLFGIHPDTIRLAVASRIRKARANEIRQHPERKTP